MEDAMASIQSEVTALFDSRAEAIGARDIDRLMRLYSPDIVYFDLVPPLRYTGSAALRSRFLDWFGRWKSAIGQETQDLHILARGDVATAHMLIRTSGMRTNGEEVGYWVRVSNSCQRTDRGWVMTHEHVSLPVDLANGGRAVMDLVP
jgi:ketosteroid isomerase-like protein